MEVEKKIIYRIPRDELIKKFRIKGKLLSVKYENEKLIMEVEVVKQTRKRKQEEQKKEVVEEVVE